MDTAEVLAHLQAHAGILRGWIARHLPRQLARVVGPEDVMQEVWLAAFRSPDVDALRTPDDWDRWLMQVAHRQLAQFERTAGRKKRPAAAAGSERLLARMVDPQASGPHGPAGEAAQHESIDAVRIALASLPERCRRVMQMRFLQGRTPVQIAKRTGMSVAAVGSALRRGVARVRLILSAAGRG